MTFSQDEINLMCIYDTSDKTVIDKLERMTNDEFSKLELEPDIDMED